MNDIKERIQNLKPNLKENSLNLYLRNLKLAWRAIFHMPNDKYPENINFLNDHKKVLNYIHTMKITTKKNYLTSFIVVIQAFKKKDLYDIYKPELDNVVKLYNQHLESQNKTPKEKKNWANMITLHNIVDGYKQQLQDKGIFTLDKKVLSNKEFFLLQRYVVGMLYTGSPNNPPIRNNYADMNIIKKKMFDKLTSEQQTLVNYLVITGKNKKHFHFNVYKTLHSYGSKIIAVDPKINKVLNIWLHYNKSPYLLLNMKREPLSKNGLTKFVNKLFNHDGKTIGTTMLRHIFISELFPADKTKKKEIAGLMSHSVDMQSEYAKV